MPNEIKMLFHILKKIPFSYFDAAIAIALLSISVVPFYISGAYHDTQRVISTVVTALALIVSIWFVQVSRKTIFLICAAYSWGFVVTSFSPILMWSMVELGLLFSVVLLGICLLQTLRKDQITSIALLLVAIHFYYASHNLIEYFFTLVLGRTFEPFALSNGFSNVRAYGQFLIWTMPFLIGVLAVNPRLPNRYILVGLLMLDWGFELITLNRSFLVAMAATLPAVWWMAKDYSKSYSTWFLFTAVGGLVIFLLMLYVLPYLLRVDISHAIKFSTGRDMLDSSGRLQLWHDAFHLMKSHPWLGAGPMTTALDSGSITSAHPHNFVLQLLAEWGIPFTFFLITGGIIGVFKLRRLVRTSPKDRSPLILPVFASLSAAVVAGLFDGLIVMPVSLMYMTLEMSVCVGIWRTFTMHEHRQKIPRWLIPIVLIPAIYVASFSILYWPNRQSPLPVLFQISGSDYKLIEERNPRFWQTGLISISKKNAPSQ